MSLKTDNFKLYKYEDNDIGDLRFINDSMDIIDKGINPFYVATESSTNVYKVTTGLNKTALNDGYSIKVAIPSNSTGAVSITVDSVTVPVKKPNGSAVTNFKANGVYSLTYYNSVFILASGGVDDVNFSASDLLTGKTANDSNGEKINGTMPNNGAKTASLNCGGSYTIPKGYHNGSGKVTANSLSSQTSANAAAKDIIKGKTAWVNGSKITGKATIQSLGGKRYAHKEFTNLELPIPYTVNLGFKPTFFWFSGINGLDKKYGQYNPWDNNYGNVTNITLWTDSSKNTTKTGQLKITDTGFQITVPSAPSMTKAFLNSFSYTAYE